MRTRTATLGASFAAAFTLATADSLGRAAAPADAHYLSTKDLFRFSRVVAQWITLRQPHGPAAAGLLAARRIPRAYGPSHRSRSVLGQNRRHPSRTYR